MLTDSSVQYYGRGQAWLGDAVAGGMPTSFDKDIPQIESLEISLSAEYAEFIGKRTSIAKKTLKVVHTIMASGKMVCAVHSAALLKTYLYASQTTITGGAASATAFAKTALPTVGDILPLPGNKVKASSVVITDSAGSPVTGTLGTDYELDADAGVIKVLSVANLSTAPWKAAFTEAAATANNIFQTTPAFQGMRFKGINLANNDAIEVVDIPKMQISPAATWTLLNSGSEVNKYEIAFEILDDGSNLTYSFGRHR